MKLGTEVACRVEKSHDLGNGRTAHGDFCKVFIRYLRGRSALAVQGGDADAADSKDKLRRGREGERTTLDDAVRR